ncbi:MAG: DinB family protein [Gemmatimonadaceae bacterium]
MRNALLLIAGLHLATTAGAQSNGTPRDVQSRMLEHQRKVLLQMVDSMPERLYRDKVTPPQRDFAGQIHHAAGAAAMISRSMMGGPALTLPDTAAAFNTRAGLRNFVTTAYDYAANLLKTQTEASRSETVDLFGNQMPRWQVWDEIHLHTVWTAGQIVANFRKHNMAPPAFTFF